MKLFGVVFFLASFIVCISGDLDWDLGEWIPIPGRCATCDKGRRLYLHSEFGSGSGTILSSENKRRKKAYSSGSSTSVPTSIFALQPKSALDDDSSRVQLVYLPEGSINDLRTARVAKVSKRPKKAHSRSVRSAPFPLEQIPFPDQFTGGSRISFREISPRRPTALVAERGKEREAQEQIQLLEAALNSPPEEVRDGELPRVFIAPTHLPPPPGYVKIPLLPSQNQVDNRRTLPGTFLTSEIHNQLPPGFVQVPLPERVSQLSHSIPFVNPNSNPLLQGNFHQQNRQQEQHEKQPQQLQPRQHQPRQHQPQQHQPQQHQPQQHQTQEHQPQDFGNSNFDFGQFNTDNSRRPQNFDSPPPVQQDFHTDQPVQHPVQTEKTTRQNIDVHQIAQNHFNIRRPITQNIESDKNIQSFDRQQPTPGHDFRDNSNIQTPHQTFDQQQEQPISQPEEQTVRDHQNTETLREHFQQEPLFETHSDSSITDHENQNDRQATTVDTNRNTNQNRVRHFQQEPLFETHSDSSITDHENQNDRQPTTVDTNRNANQNRVRQQRIRPQNNLDQSVQNVPSTTASSLTFKPHTNSFFEIGSSVIKPQNDFDYDPFNNLPDFNVGNDYGQDFALYDNQDFDFPVNTPDKSVTSTKQKNQEPSPVTHPQTQTTFNEDNVPSTIQAEDSVITENPRIVPFQLSPKPIPILPTLSPSPVETVSIEPEVLQARSELEQPATQKPFRIQLSPKPVEETENTDNVEDSGTPSVQLNNRRRIRPTSFRGRTPSSSSRHRLNLSPKKVEDTQVTIGSAVVTKDVVEDTVPPVSPTSLPSLPTRSRFSNRRRRPFKQETTTKSEVVTEISTTTKPAEASSTLFPPFSVAKRLNENPTAAQETGSRRNPPSLRGRFGSRIRARTQEDDSTKIAETQTETETSDTLTVETLPPRRRGQRRRRLRARNGQPSNKRRRRVLNRVRKIDSETSDDSLNNQIQKEEGLTGAESARVVVSQAPLNKVADPIAETSTLISDERINRDTESVDKANENLEKKSNLEGDDNIFNLLNLFPSIAEEINLKEVSTERSSFNHNLTTVAEDTEGYVNNSEPLSLPDHSFDEPSTKLLSFESQSSIPKHDIGTLDTNISKNINESLSSSPSSFDSPLSTPSQSTHISPEAESSGTVLEGTHVEHDKSPLDLQHALQHDPIENDKESMTLPNDNIHNLLPENKTGLQDNYFDYDIDNGTFLGSSAHVVYAVALTESPEENDLTTLIPNEIDSTADQTTEKGFQSSTSTSVKNATDSSSVDVHETTLASLVANVSPKEFFSELFDDETLETRSILDEVFEITESPVLHPESSINFDDTTSIDNETLIENIILPIDSNVRTENEEMTTEETVFEEMVPETEVTETSFLHLDETNESKSTSIVDSNHSEVTTEQSSDNTETKTEANDESLNPKTNEVVSNSTEKSIKNVTEENSSKNSSLANSFLNSFFHTEREGKENNIEVDDGSPIIIGKSTVTEVRSSAPVICIDGNCVIGAGIRKR